MSIVIGLISLGVLFAPIVIVFNLPRPSGTERAFTGGAVFFTCAYWLGASLVSGLLVNLFKPIPDSISLVILVLCVRAGLEFATRLFRIHKIWEPLLSWSDPYVIVSLLVFGSWILLRDVPSSPMRGSEKSHVVRKAPNVIRDRPVANNALLSSLNKKESVASVDSYSSPYQQDLPEMGPLPVNPAKTFRKGSTYAEVYVVQGRPDRVDGNTWWYGGSWVDFKNKVVVDFRSADPSRPLRATIPR